MWLIGFQDFVLLYCWLVYYKMSSNFWVLSYHFLGLNEIQAWYTGTNNLCIRFTAIIFHPSFQINLLSIWNMMWMAGDHLEYIIIKALLFMHSLFYSYLAYVSSLLLLIPIISFSQQALNWNKPKAFGTSICCLSTSGRQTAHAPWTKPGPTSTFEKYLMLTEV